MDWSELEEDMALVGPPTCKTCTLLFQFCDLWRPDMLSNADGR